MIKCPGIATKWYSINHDIFFNCLIIMGILFYSLTSRCSREDGVVAFAKPFAKLLESIGEKCKALKAT